MKTTTEKNNTASNFHSSKPFFNKNKKGSSFSTSQEVENPFFSPLSVPKKLAPGSYENVHRKSLKTDEHSDSRIPNIQLQEREEQRRRQGRTLSLFASGYPRNYNSDDEEITAIEYRSQNSTYDPENPQQSWWPTTRDFRAVARRHGGRARGVSNLSQFISILRGQRNISLVRLITHGARGEIQFGRSRLSLDNIEGLPNLSRNFTQNGRIIFYACNSAQGDARFDQNFFQVLANRLGVTVCGFTRGVQYRVDWNERRRIISRGLENRELPSPNICENPE